MPHSNARRRKSQIELLRTQFAQKNGLPFAEVLPNERIDKALQEEGATWRDCVYAPALLLWAFLSQVIAADGSCRAAVARVLAWLVARGERPCSPNTDPYCKARKRLPEKLLDAVRGAAKRQGVPYQRFIRMAIESALDKGTRK